MPSALQLYICKLANHLMLVTSIYAIRLLVLNSANLVKVHDQTLLLYKVIGANLIKSMQLTIKRSI